MARVDEAREWRDRLVGYLWEQGRDANSQSQAEDIRLALAIVVCGDVESAYVRAFGIRRDRFLRERANREWRWGAALRAWEHEVQQADGVRRSAAGSGAVYEMPSPEEPSKQEPVREVSRRAKRSDAATTVKMG